MHRQRKANRKKKGSKTEVTILGEEKDWESGKKRKASVGT